MAALYLILSASKEAVFLCFLYRISLQIRRRTMGRICFLIALCSVVGFYKRIFHAFAGLLGCSSILTAKYGEFGCGVLTFWCFSRICHVLVLFFVLILGFKVLQINENWKYRKGLASNCVDGDQFDGVNDLSRVSAEMGQGQNLEEMDDRADEQWDGCCDEDQVFDVMSLRKMVKVQRRRANFAECELEKERMAASSAADETLAMILRLQNEKSSLRMQVNQLQRLAEEKELHDESVVQSLEWTIMQQEYKICLLEDLLRFCREKLKLFLKDEEWDHFDTASPSPSVSPSSCGGSRFDDAVISSLELESSPFASPNISSEV